MSHSYSKIWLHAIWSTKDRQPFIEATIEKAVYAYLKKQFADLGCPVSIMNGMPDHVHCLFLLNPQKSVADVIKQVKGSSSHWLSHDYADRIGQNHVHSFAWQTGYAAYSVSESQLDKVFRYIKSQKQHHKKLSFEQEFEAFLQRNKIENG